MHKNRKYVCFISLGNIYLCPFIDKYIENIKCKFDIIYWDRHNVKEKISAERKFAFRYNLDESASKFQKLKGYLLFREYAKKILKRNKYDGIVALQTSVGILLKSTLKSMYKHKYIIDIRDYTMEKNKIFLSMEHDLIKHSAFTVISSSGYKTFLPKADYIVVHNDIDICSEKINLFRAKQKNKNNKIVISCIGLIRFYEQNKIIINVFKEDNRYELRFIGKGAKGLAKFCEENEINNVKLIDQFPKEKTLDYYFDTDVVYNLYGNNAFMLDYSLSNKLYYAAQLGMPILVSPKTYMEKVSVNNGFGFSFNLEETNVLNDFFKFYNQINWNNFYFNCDNFIEKVRVENNNFIKSIKNFIYQI